MKTQILKFFFLIICLLNAKALQAQVWITASPPDNDYCNAVYQTITLTANNYNPAHTYEWSYEDNSLFSYYGPSYNTVVFATGQSTQVTTGYYGACTRIMVAEYDTNHYMISSSFFLLCASNSGPIPAYNDLNNCQTLLVPNDYYYQFIPGRWAMWFRDGTSTGISDPFIDEPATGNWQYKLKLSCGDTIVSDPINVNNNPPAPVVSASGSTTVCNGDTVLLTSQPGFNTYQWLRNGTNIPGATGSSYKATVSGNYSVRVLQITYYNNYCSKESPPLTVTVQSGAFITSADSVECKGDSIMLQCATAGNYVWKRNGSIISGAVTQSIYVKTSGNYKVITTGLTCNTSKAKNITFYSYPTISTTPSGTLTLCNGTGITLSASGTNINSYQWYKGGVSITGGNTSTIFAAKNGNYKCIVANAIGCTKSSPAITLNAATSNTLPTKTITLKPGASGIDTYIESYAGGQSTNYGSSPFMEVSAWYKYFRIADRALLKFDLSAIPQNAPVISSTLKLYVDSIVQWNTPAQTLQIKLVTQSWQENIVTWFSQPAITDYMGIIIPHDSVKNHSWFEANVADIVNYWINYSSQNNGMLIQMNEYANPPSWLRLVSSDNANAAGRPKLSVKYAYADIVASSPLTFCTGDSVIFTTNNGPYSYQWYNNNTAIAGSTAAYTAKTDGDYFVVITNASGCTVASETKHVTVNAKPAATISASGPTTFCNGDSVKLQANTGSGIAFQWQKNNTNIVNATSQIYTAKSAGTYRVKVTNASGCTKYSPTLNINVPCRMTDESSTVTGFDIFPNPSQDDFKIVADNNAPVELLMVFDAEGRLIETDQNVISGFVIGGQWQKGIYTLQLKTDAVIIYRRVVKL